MPCIPLAEMRLSQTTVSCEPASTLMACMVLYLPTFRRKLLPVAGSKPLLVARPLLCNPRWLLANTSLSTAAEWSVPPTKATAMAKWRSRKPRTSIQDPPCRPSIRKPFSVGTSTCTSRRSAPLAAAT
jgi:hypothetical protein